MEKGTPWMEPACPVNGLVNRCGPLQTRRLAICAVGGRAVQGSNPRPTAVRRGRARYKKGLTLLLQVPETA